MTNPMNPTANDRASKAIRTAMCAIDSARNATAVECRRCEARGVVMALANVGIITDDAGFEFIDEANERAAKRIAALGTR